MIPCRGEKGIQNVTHYPESHKLPIKSQTTHKVTNYPESHKLHKKSQPSCHLLGEYEKSSRGCILTTSRIHHRRALL